MVMNPETGRVYSVTEAGTIVPVGEPPPAQAPTIYETQYTYQYDGYGNWTEQTTVTRFSPDADWGPMSILHRKLTYC